MRDPHKKTNSLPLPQLSNDAVERVAAKAQEFKPDDARKFKSTTMPFNEYEHDLLTRAVEKHGGTAKQFIRDAYIERALRILEGKPIASN